MPTSREPQAERGQHGPGGYQDAGPAAVSQHNEQRQGGNTADDALIGMLNLMSAMLQHNLGLNMSYNISVSVCPTDAKRQIVSQV